MFFAFAGKRGEALAWLEINPFNASMPKPQEACWRKPRRVNAGAIEPGQIGCFMASQELAKIGRRTAYSIGLAVVNEFLGVENSVGQLGPRSFIMLDINRGGKGTNSCGPLEQFLRAW